MVTSQALRQFVDTINATGGVIRFPTGCFAPQGDPDWIDLGEAYPRLVAEVEECFAEGERLAGIIRENLRGIRSAE